VVKRTLYNLQLFPDLPKGTWALESHFHVPGEGLGIFFSTFAAIMTDGLIKQGCENQFLMVLEQDKTGCKKETKQPALQIILKLQRIFYLET
jgi:hypothetical protein